jgi:carbonic anhydrase
MEPFRDLLEANEALARDGGTTPPPGAARGLAVVACMDSRVEPAAALGLGPGDALVLRNPGAQVTDEVLKALIVGVQLGVERILVMGHTDCLMTKRTDDELRSAVAETSGTDASGLHFGAIDDPAARIAADVERIRSSPFIPDDVAVLGSILDLETGRLRLA